MGYDPTMRSLNLRRAAITAALVFLDWLFVRLLDSPGSLRWVDRALWPVGGDYVIADGWQRCLEAGAVVFPALTLLAVVAFVVRLMVRQRLRASGADPLDPVRRWVAKRRWVVRAICVAPALLALDGRTLGDALDLLLGRYGPHSIVKGLTLLALGVVAPAAGVAAVLRGSLAVALSPLLTRDELERTDADGFLFYAVAVTPESIAMVVLFALASAGVLAALAGMSFGGSVSDSSVAIAYATAVVLGAFSFQRASRIALGLDGVRIGGTSRQRFYAYHGLDAVDVNRAGDILVRRHDRVVLRLQLHGEDAGRRAPIVARLREAIARAHAPGGAARRLAEAASPALLAQAARGDGDYRSPAAPRDALWEVVEAPSASGEARARAAQALAAAADGADRARLRFAAERCAHPPTRQALARIAAVDEEAEADEADEAEAPAGGATRRRATLQAAGR
jgi:hypothetical protein